MLLFGGFFLKNGSVPVYLDWIRFLSWFMYGNEALSINQWHGVTFENEQCQYVNTNLTAIVPPECSGGDNQNLFDLIIQIFTGYQASIVCSGDDILETFNFNPVSIFIQEWCMCLHWRLLVHLCRISSFAIFSVFAPLSSDSASWRSWLYFGKPIKNNRFRGKTLFVYRHHLIFNVFLSHRYCFFFFLLIEIEK